MEKKEIPSWDEIREMMAENAKGFAELRKRQEETDELIKKTNEQIEKANEQTNEQIKRTEAMIDKVGQKIDKAHEQIVGTSNNTGFHAEQYFQNALNKSKIFGGEKYDKMIPNLKLEDKESCEFDIFLVNGKSVAIIEAKNRIHPNFVKEMVTKKTVQFRKFFPEYKDYGLRLGIAGFSFCDEVVLQAKKYGVGIIRQVGDSIDLDDRDLKVY
jgi:uncharacterized protein YdcH (DUF465 family)